MNANDGYPLLVREGFLDEHVDVTASGGHCWSIDANSKISPAKPNHVPWTHYAEGMNQ